MQGLFKFSAIIYSQQIINKPVKSNISGCPYPQRNKRATNSAVMIT